MTKRLRPPLHRAAPIRGRVSRGFSLIELLVSMSVIAILLLVVAAVLSNTQSVHTQARARTMQHRDARSAFDAMAARLSQATLNSYWGYRLDASGNPLLYQRESELHFVSGPAQALLPEGAASCGHAVFFQAPLSVTAGEPADLDRMDDLMNAWGYHVEFNSDLPRRPEALAGDTLRNPERRAFRLMEFRLPSEKLDLYRPVDNPAGATLPAVPWITAQSSQADLYAWFRSHLDAHSEPVADHVLALVIQPVAPGLASESAPGEYLYDSRRFQWETPGNPGATARLTRHQLPPTLRLTLVALDDDSWRRLTGTEADAVSAKLKEELSPLFRRTGSYQDDLKTLGTTLDGLKLGHRVFATQIPIRSARWMTAQD